MAWLLVAMGWANFAMGQSAPMRLVRTLPMPGVRGRIDHLSVDVRNERLFVSALASDALEIFDLKNGKLIRTLHGLSEPQGNLYMPASNRLFVANGGNGDVRIFDGTTFRLLRTLHFPSDADDLRRGASAGTLFLAYGEGAIAELDSSTGKILGEVRVDGHPEAFAFDAGTIFVNVPAANEIEVLDWAGKRVAARWKLGANRWNFPMAIDRADHRLFVVCRRPEELLVLDTSSGKIVTHLSAVGDPDDVYFDHARKRLYISGGAGDITVIQQLSPDRYRLIANLPTAPGARTSLFVPALGRFYLAVPRRGSAPAEIRVYQVE